MILYPLTFTISHEKKIFFIKEYLEPILPGVGSSGVIEILQNPDAGSHTAARALFTYPSPTPNLYRSHDTHHQVSTP